VKRTDYCGLVDRRYLDQIVTVTGWVHRRRDHGGVIFIDLRDREGLLQVVADPDRAAVKRAFDPRGILNPGAKVAAEGARAVTDVKYDPSLAPLPESARAALARVERERAYARLRLALLDEATERLDAPASGV